MGFLDKVAEAKSTSNAALREMMPPIMLSVQYSGNLTITHSLRDYEGRRWAPISDGMFNIDLNGTFLVPVICSPILQSGMRRLNTPELLELGRQTAQSGKVFYGGQEISTAFGKQLPYVIRHDVGLMPSERCRNKILPATWAPDPLVARIPAPS